MISAAIFILIYMCVWFALSVWRRDMGIVDVGWGLGFVVWTWLRFFGEIPIGAWSLSHILLLISVTCWGLRLSAHIGYRDFIKEKEDWRYAAWRNEWGDTVLWRSFLQVFMLQGVFLWVIALPITLAPPLHLGTEHLEHPLLFLLRMVGFIVFLFGFVYETVADWQLLQFTLSVRVKGEILKTGLWKYSRHPNYFGEIVVWWGVFIIAMPYGAIPIVALALLSPLTITWLLNRVSGVPMLERRWTENAEYQTYIHTTNPLIPKL